MPRDVIVIGCSAGGLEALGQIVPRLPADLPASVTIVQHLAPTHEPHLVPILARDATLPIRWAEQGTPLEHARIYVAPPDAHVVFVDDHLALSKAPRENHSRPSIDLLFRSAAQHHGRRVIGVLLTGMLQDGVAGLREIQAAGGLAIVQDPADAAYPDLPAHAIEALAPDRVLPVAAIADELVALATASTLRTT